MMGLKPWETDRLTPAEFHGMWTHWKRMNLKPESTLSAPTAEQLREAAEAERKWGSPAA
jgi:hypothetical protein